MSVIAFSSEGYLTYSLTFLLLEPAYTCVRNGIRFECDQEQTCTPLYNRETNTMYKNGFHTDWHSQVSLHNWYEMFDLRCQSVIFIGLFAASYFAGQVFGTTYFASYGDRYGRVTMLRRVMIASLLIQISLTLVSRSLISHYFLIFIQGFISNMRSSLAYLYGQEMTLKSHASFVGSIYNIVDALTMCWMSFYFKYVSKEWVYSQGICAGLISISCILAY
jgi:MFS family permease